ncbi:MAG: nicotinate phosphoribosyltransferase [Halobacteriales archaeon]
MTNSFDVVPERAISEGRATDEYFLRTEEALEHAGENPYVVAEIEHEVDEWHVFAGLKDAVTLLEGRDVDVYAVPEGTVFKQGPVLRIEGPYLEFCRFETSLLGFLCRPTAVATRAMHAVAAADGRSVVSFGTRREHPSTAAVIERAALIGGVDGVSHVAAADVIGTGASGTMPHSLVISLRDQERAWKAYDAVAGDSSRVALVDTYCDEKTEAVRAAEALGDALDGVRLDTTGSRRGDMREIAEEVRWELDVRGYEGVDVFVSGGVDVDEILRLRDVVDGFGVGGYIASPSPVDFSMNLVEVEGEPSAKRGVRGYAKQVYRDGLDDTVVREGETAEGKPLLEQVVDSGEVVVDFDFERARERVMNVLPRLRDGEHALGFVG